MAENGTRKADFGLEQGWDACVPQNPELGYYTVGDAVQGAAEEAEEQRTREALSKIAQALKMVFSQRDWESPEGPREDRYEPYMVLQDGRRTMREEDLDETDLGALLVAGATRAENPWVKSRLGDLVHRMRMRGSIAPEVAAEAEEAGRAAALAVLEVDPGKATVEAQYLVVRATSIAADLRETHPEAREEVAAYCEKILEAAADAEQARPEPWMVEAAQEGLWRLETAKGQEGRVVETLRRIARRYTDEDGPGAWTEAAWKSALRWARAVEDPNERRRLERECEWGWGEETLLFAVAEDQDDSALRRLILYDRAIPHLTKGAKVAGDARERRASILEEAKRERTKYAERVRAGEGMTPIEVPLPVREAGQKRAQEIRDKLRGKSLQTVMGTLAFGIGNLEKKEYFSEAAEPLYNSLAQFATRTKLDHGYPLGESRGRLPDNEMTVFDGWARHLVVAGVGPCLAAISEEHGEGRTVEEWAEGMCANSEWTPAHAAESWAQGIAVGMRGNWKKSMDLLIPRMEGCIRALNRKRGLDETSLTLDLLLTQPRYRDLMSEEWRFALDAAAINRRGWNLRNDHCHGRMGDGEYASLPCVFFWWLALHFTASGMYVRSAPFHSLSSEDLRERQKKKAE